MYKLLLFILMVSFFACKSSSSVIKEENYVNIKLFGAIPNDNIDDSKAIQAAIDYAIQDKKSSLVYCPPGVYDLVQGVVITNQKNNGEYFFVTLTIKGNTATYAGDQSIGKTTVFRLKNPTFGIALQSARNCVIENIVFEGCAKYSTDPVKIIEWEENDWGIKSNASTNSNSPSCAIVIDPFHKNVRASDRYKGHESKYTNTSNGGSSMVVVRGCSFFNHYIAIANNPSNGVQNGDNIRAENCHVSTCHTFWSAGQTQSRANSIDNVYAMFLHTFISGTEIGDKIGTPPSVSNLNLAGFCKQVIDVQTGFSGVNFYRSYMESIWSLGISNGLSTSFDQCQISFDLPSVKYFMPPFLLAATNSVAFRDCNLQYFSNCTVPMPMLMRCKGLIISGGSVEGGVIVADGYTNAGGDDMHKVSFDNVQIKCLGKVAGKKSSEKPRSNLANEIIMGGEMLLSSDGGMYINQGTTYDVNYTEEASLQVDNNTKMAYFISRMPNQYQLGDNIFTLSDVNPKLAGMKIQDKIRSPLGYISNITDNKISVSGIPYGYSSQNIRVIVVRFPILTAGHISKRNSKAIRYLERDNK